ncbi:MAG TPA: hypothetical protein VK972_03525, partial [Wenzhouxiangella sp.]|nr:hypothetical protein [Wenzhouxiangella sp.]
LFFSLRNLWFQKQQPLSWLSDMPDQAFLSSSTRFFQPGTRKQERPARWLAVHRKRPSNAGASA